MVHTVRGVCLLHTYPGVPRGVISDSCSITPAKQASLENIEGTRNCYFPLSPDHKKKNKLKAITIRPPRPPSSKTEILASSPASRFGKHGHHRDPKPRLLKCLRWNTFQTHSIVLKLSVKPPQDGRGADTPCPPLSWHGDTPTTRLLDSDARFLLLSVRKESRDLLLHDLD